MYPDFPRSPHRLDSVLLAGPKLFILFLVEATATAKEEAVLILNCVKGKDWFVRGSEADTGVTSPALGMLALTVALTNWNCLNDHLGTGVRFYSL